MKRCTCSSICWSGLYSQVVLLCSNHFYNHGHALCIRTMQPPVYSGHCIKQPPVYSCHCIKQPPVYSGHCIKKPPVYNGHNIKQPSL